VTDTPEPNPLGGPGSRGDVGEEVPGGDTTVRLSRVPAPPDPVALADTDHADDTVIVHRGPHRRSDPALASAVSPAAIAGAAYPSRVAAPVRGSRKGQSAAVRDDRAATSERAAAGERTLHEAIPDASGIRRSLRARARRRLAALVMTIVALVVVLLAALVALVFAAGV
jgi:hypothetical protein